MGMRVESEALVANRTFRPARPAPFWSLISRRNWAFWGLLVLLLLLWQFGAKALNQPLIIVPLTDVIHKGVELWQAGTLPADLATSAEEFIFGFLAGSLVGVVCGHLTGYFRAVGKAVDPLVAMLYAVPIIAVAPVFIIAFGLGIESKVLIVAIETFFCVTLTTTAGVRAIDATFMDLSKVFGLQRMATMWKVIVPYSVPYMLSGLRVATGRGITAVLAAELFGAKTGIGLMILNASTTFDTATVYLGVVIFAVVGAALTKFWYVAERRIAPWRTTES
jgi:NitT/TauT family transport system permease protein